MPYKDLSDLSVLEIRRILKTIAPEILFTNILIESNVITIFMAVPIDDIYYIKIGFEVKSNINYNALKYKIWNMAQFAKTQYFAGNYSKEGERYDSFR